MKEKKLFIVRHAKSEEHSFSKTDFERNIIDKGIKRTTKLANQIKSNIKINEETLFISSDANRAIQTAEILAQILNYPIHSICQRNNIYEASFKDILKEINKVPHHINTLIIVGHNPGLSDLTNYICNTYISLSTSAIAKITLEENFNFNELSGSTATLEKVYTE